MSLGDVSAEVARLARRADLSTLLFALSNFAAVRSHDSHREGDRDSAETYSAIHNQLREVASGTPEGF